MGYMFRFIRTIIRYLHYRS